MTCIKTGAYVSLPDYGLFAACDLYQVGDSIIIRFSCDPRDVGSNYCQERKVTHIVKLNFAGTNFIRFDIGIVVVESRAVIIPPIQAGEHK